MYVYLYNRRREKSHLSAVKAGNAMYGCIEYYHVEQPRPLRTAFSKRTLSMATRNFSPDGVSGTGTNNHPQPANKRIRKPPLSMAMCNDHHDDASGITTKTL